MLRGPGKYLLAMIWWILVFFFLRLYSYPFRDYLSSYLVFFIPLAFTVAVGFILNLFESKFRFWSTRSHWGRCFIITSAYTGAIGASLIITIVLDSRNLVAYFGGDPEGSFGVLYVPSIVFYWIAGAVVCGLVSLIQVLKTRR